MTYQFLGLGDQLQALTNLIIHNEESMRRDPNPQLPTTYQGFSGVLLSLIVPTFGHIKLAFYGNLNVGEPAKYLLVGDKSVGRASIHLYKALNLSKTPTRESLRQAFLAALAGVEAKVLALNLGLGSEDPAGAVHILDSFADNPQMGEVILATATITGIRQDPMPSFQIPRDEWQFANKQIGANILRFGKTLGSRATFFLDPRDFSVLSVHTLN